MHNLNDKNIVLIGMCGVGKSTIGVLLAKALSRDFLDTDVFIQALEQRPLQQIIDETGLDAFCRLEEEYILRVNIKNAVIATGGSVVYSQNAMKHLAANGLIVHLDLDYDSIEKRVTNLCTRGVVMTKNQTLSSLFDKRQPLYKKFAQLTINCSGKNHDQVIDEISSALKASQRRS